MKRVFIIPVVLMLLSANMEAQEKIVVKADKNKVSSVEIINQEQIPVVIIDGKRYDSDVLRLIDNELIARVDVYKGKEAQKLYNEPAVIVVTSKEKAKGKQEVKIRFKLPEEGTADAPVYIIDGRVADPGEIEKILPDNIESITVLKNEESKKKYNSESGVIQIVTKKKDL
jgi:hypothetical protein